MAKKSEKKAEEFVVCGDCDAILKVGEGKKSAAGIECPFCGYVVSDN